MRNRQGHGFNAFILRLALLISFLMAGVGSSAREMENTEAESADKARPVPERKDQSDGTNKEPSVFVPTEKISADKDISFPTDI